MVFFSGLLQERGKGVLILYGEGLDDGWLCGGGMNATLSFRVGDRNRRLQFRKHSESNFDDDLYIIISKVPGECGGDGDGDRPREAPESAA